MIALKIDIMTAGAVFLVLHVEGLLPIMASAAEISLGDPWLKTTVWRSWV